MHLKSSYPPSHPGILSFSIHEDDHIGHTKHPCQNQHRPSNLSVLTPENPLIAFRPSLIGKPTLCFIITRIPSTSSQHFSKLIPACIYIEQHVIAIGEQEHIPLHNHQKKNGERIVEQWIVEPRRNVHIIITLQFHSSSFLTFTIDNANKREKPRGPSIMGCIQWI